MNTLVMTGWCCRVQTLSQIKAALACLIEIKAVRLRSAAVSKSLALTALGFHLAKMPVDVRIGKMLLLSTLLGCTEEALTVAATLSAKSPFLSAASAGNSGDRRELLRTMQRRFLRYREYTNNNDDDDHTSGIAGNNGDVDVNLDPYPFGDSVQHCRSDHIAAVHAFRLFQETLQRRGSSAAFNFCREYFLSFHALKEIDALRDYYRAFLLESGFASPLPLRSLSATSLSNQSSKRERENGANNSNINSNINSREAQQQRQSRESFSEILVEDTAENVFDRDLLRCALCGGMSSHYV
jgi:HrpA-like RNA helicase